LVPSQRAASGMCNGSSRSTDTRAPRDLHGVETAAVVDGGFRRPRVLAALADAEFAPELVERASVTVELCEGRIDEGVLLGCALGWCPPTDEA
jgi:hypothetical protein